MRHWLTFALLSLVCSGCAGAHGVETDAAGHAPAPDAAPARDGGSLVLDVHAPMMCRPVVVTDAQAPAAVDALTPIPVHLVSTDASSVSCGCQPVTAIADDGTVSLTACDCCNDCDCIDFGYEATVIENIMPGTPHDVPITLSSAPLVTTTIVDASHCVAGGATVIGIMPLGPNDRLRQGTPVGAWVQVQAIEGRCCGEPLELVTHTVAADGAIELSLAECHPDPCDCPSDEPHDASTPAYLGALAPGTYTVRAGTVSTTLTVP